MASAIRAGALALVSSFSMAQSPDFTVRVEVPLVTVEVTVTDRNGRPVDGLRAADFLILDEGIPRPIGYFDPVTSPWHIYLLLDVSGSTEDRRPFMLDVVSGFLGQVRVQDRVAIGVFGQDAETLVDWDEPRVAYRDGIEEWARKGLEEGTTRFYGSLKQVLEGAFDAIPERRAVIVLTDGRDQSLYRQLQRTGRLQQPEEDQDFTDVREAAERAAIPVYFVALNTDLNLRAEFEGNEYRSLRILYPGADFAGRYLEQVRIRMEQVAAVTGGKVFFPSDPANVVPAVEEITTSIAGAYSLGWIPTSSAGGPSPRSIEVRVSDPDYRIQQSRDTYQP
jgi:VWFA-related protein